jgi:hypothetical protein
MSQFDNLNHCDLGSASERVAALAADGVMRDRYTDRRRIIIWKLDTQ